MAGQPGNKSITEIWDGSSWTEVGDMNTARRAVAADGGSNTAIVSGGNIPPRSALTEFWNGSSWTEVADLSTARSGNASGNSTNGFVTSFAAGGSTTTAATNLTEEWTVNLTNKTITSS
jgi:hypothetical protein